VARLIADDVPAAREHRGQTVAESNNRDGVTNSVTTRSNHAEYVVSRLKRDDPALAERVVNGEITANAAAREKGWRKPRVVLTSPESIATALRKHLGPDDIARLIKLLLDEP
jgi:hypothetical protein